MHKIIEIIKKNKIYTNKKYFILFLLALGLITYYLYTTITKVEAVTTYDLVKVERGDILSFISGSGQIISETQIDTKGESGGQIMKVNIKAGDKVKKGQILAIFDQRSVSTSLAGAQNNVVSAKASYDKFINGLTETEKQTYNISVENAEENLKNSKQNLIDKLKLINLDLKNDLVATNNLFTNYNTSYPSWSGDGISVNNSLLQSNLVSKRGELNIELVNFENEINNLNAENVENYIKKTNDFLNKNYSYFDDMHNLFVNNTVSDTSVATKISTYVNLASSAKTKIRNNINSINTNLQNIENAKNSLQQSKITLNTKTENPREEDIKIQKANLNNAYINLQSAQNAFEKTFVRAPFTGTVATVNAKAGEMGITNIATIIADEKQAKIQVSESDVIKIKNGQKVKLSFDSIENENFEGLVDSIDVLGTISSGVVTYNVYIKLNSKDIRIKPNMSVNAEILLSELKDVLKVDNNAVKGEDEKFVNLVKNPVPLNALDEVELLQKPEKVFVKIGESNDEFTEVKEGLNENDIVVVKINNPQNATKQNSLFNMFRPSGNNRSGNTATQTGTQRNFQR